jgi:hypothetical protein
MKVSAFDTWLDKFEKSLYDAAENVRRKRIERSPICTGCRHRRRTYAYPRCSECEPTGTMFEAGEEGYDDER